MNSLPRHSETLSPGWQLFLLLGLVVAGLSLGSLLAMGLAIGGFGLSRAEFTDLMIHPARYPQGWAALMVVEGISLAGLGVGAFLLPVVQRLPAERYFAPQRLVGWWPLAAALLVLVLGPALSVVIAWNAGVHFPDWAQGFAEWAREKEDAAQVLTRFLTSFTSGGRLLVGLLVIAVVPAVAEELVFRGSVQRNLVRLVGRHGGVWLAAALFSAVHFEFFGFVPRLLLGAVLGYLYEWSGNILVPMAAHFVQNASQLLLLYLAQGHRLPTTLNPDSTQALPWPAVLVSAVLTLGLLVLLYQRQRQPAPEATV